MSKENLALERLEKWEDKGHESTHYQCKHCKGQVKIRQPEPNMVPPKGCWEGVKECYICQGLSIVKTFPNGNTIVE